MGLLIRVNVFDSTTVFFFFFVAFMSGSGRESIAWDDMVKVIGLRETRLTRMDRLQA